MPRTSIMAVAAAIITAWMPPMVAAAKAAGGDGSGAGRVRDVITYATDRGDPYAYQFERRGYYPYYGSQYWRPAGEMLLYRDRYRHELPRYYPAWGYPQPLPAAPPRRHGSQY
jgi:hypothetical protein